MIPFSDPYASYLSHKEEIDLAIDRVLQSGIFVLGKEVEFFEQEFALFHGNNLDAVGVANGTDAVALCLLSLGLTAGDEVITSSHTAIATVAGIEQAGCSPVLADIDSTTRCICPKSIESRISEKTRAIMPVHIYGQPCDMFKILEIAKENNLSVIEDCSQAHGAEIGGKKIGTFGTLSVFSCYPTKNLGGIGDGGIILCTSHPLAEKLRSIRQYGWNENRESINIGLNSRLDELQASILRVKLKYLISDNEKRRQLADYYDIELKGLPLVLPNRPKNEIHAMHLYVIESDERDELLNYLRKQGIGASLHYQLPIHRHRAYSRRLRGCENLPITNKLYDKILTLPLYPEIEMETIEKIAASIIKYFSK